MRRSALVLAGSAISLAAADLVQKWLAAPPPAAYNPRPAWLFALMGLVALAEAIAVPLARSVSLALAAGVLLGGAVGNLASLALWGRGVPDPFLAGGPAGGLFYNLADVLIAVGLVLLVGATAVFALRNRPRLCQPLGSRGR